MLPFDIDIPRHILSTSNKHAPPKHTIRLFSPLHDDMTRSLDDMHPQCAGHRQMMSIGLNTGDIGAVSANGLIPSLRFSLHAAKAELIQEFYILLSCSPARHTSKISRVLPFRKSHKLPIYFYDSRYHRDIYFTFFFLYYLRVSSFSREKELPHCTAG